MSSLVSHIAARLSPHPENIATEALAHVLNTSQTARKAIEHFLRSHSVNLGRLAVFETQEHGDNATIPDLVGFDTRWRKRITIESKFWAGLTDKQPVEYLRQLPAGFDSLLLFVVPDSRINSLWDELIERLEAAGEHPRGIKLSSSLLKLARVGRHRLLALCSWTALISAILPALDAEKDTNAAADLRQLEGLCTNTEFSGFTPFSEGDLAPSVAKSVLQFNDLVSDVVDELRRCRLVTVRGLRKAAGRGGYWRFFRLKGHGCYLSCDLLNWAKFGVTPLWLGVTGKEWKRTTSLREAMARFQRQTSKRVYPDGKWSVIPLKLTLRRERDVVIKDLVQQIKEVALRLRK
ncbi:MAG: hypothetical protein HY301_20250 [Verrucomicrobia bacterium]|nr:hypothetical protein [Verrucomicrobiota bacterium]